MTSSTKSFRSFGRRKSSQPDRVDVRRRGRTCRRTSMTDEFNQIALHESRQRADVQDDVQTVADESKVVEEQVDEMMEICHRS